MNDYLNGTILEMLERVKALKTKIPVVTLPACFHQLATASIVELDSIILNLDTLLKHPKFQVSANLSHKLIVFQKLVNNIDYMENYLIAAINRSSNEDEILTNLVQKVCKEINYPLLPPVASRLSQSYYCIDTKYNHLRVPLLESEFLLHMPDLYHELSHPLISVKNHPSVTAYQVKLGQLIVLAQQHFEDEATTFRRNNDAQLAVYLDLYADSWIQGWAVEFFCDLFGIYTLGPAFAWAHLHLCVKRGTNPFETPQPHPISHPADHARMQAILMGLELIEFKEEKIQIENFWKKYVAVSGGVIDANFKMAYPKQLLEFATTLCLDATKQIKCRIASKDSDLEVNTLLNIAWKKFIHDPAEYIIWETEQREKYNV